MKKYSISMLFFVVFGLSGLCWADSSAVSQAGSQSNATAIGITNNNPTANAGASSQAGVNFSSDPSASAVGVGGGGGSASAQAGGGSASAEGGRVDNVVGVNPTINPTITSTVNPQINPTISGSNSVNAGQTVAPNTQSSVSIDSHAVTKNNYVNRQLPQVGVPGDSGPMQYFGTWDDQAPNVFPIIYGEWSSTSNEVEIPYEDIFGRFHRTFPAHKKPVNFVKYREVVAGDLVWSGLIKLDSTQITDDAQAIAFAYAQQNGGDTIEVLASSADKIPTTKGWHVGFGAGASGVIGADEKAGLSGAGGTGFGKSTIRKVPFPFMQVRIWHNATVVKDGETVKRVDLQPATDYVKEWQTTK